MGFKKYGPARAIFMALSLGGMILLGGCGNLSRQPLGPEQTTTIQKGSSENTAVSPKAAKVASGASSKTSVKKTQSSTPSTSTVSPLSTYSLGDGILPPEGGNP